MRLELVFRRRRPHFESMYCRELLRDPRVRFAGYKHPHPLDNDILIRVQSAGVHPTQSFGDAAARLEDEFRLISSKFDADVTKLREREATDL